MPEGRIRIFHIETGRQLYGGAQQVVYLLNGLDSSCFENHLVCTKDSAIQTALSESNIISHPLPMRGEGDIFFLRRLLHLARKYRPHIIHAHSRRGADIYGGLAAKLTGCKSIITRRVDNPESPLLSRLKYGQYDQVVTISNGISNVLAAQGVPEHKTSMIHSAVDIKRYDRQGDMEWFRREFGLDPESLPVAMIAQFIERKGHIDLVRAAPIIHTQFPDARFILFGKGPLERHIRNIVYSENLEDIFIFGGFRSDLRRIFPCLQLVVHPARMEGLGVSLLQAAAAGVPIVATPVGGIPEIIENDTSGLLVPPNAPNHLANAVISLLQDEKLRARFSEMGKKRVRQHFSIQAMVDGYTGLYNELVKATSL